MDIDIQSVGFSVDQKLVDFIHEKTEKLTHFYDRIIYAEIFLKVDRKSAQQNKIAEFKIGIPGKDLFAKKQCDTFEEASVEALEAARRQITKHKGKVLA
jgi:putative sigma-54 modulation protein